MEKSYKTKQKTSNIKIYREDNRYGGGRSGSKEYTNNFFKKAYKEKRINVPSKI